MPKVWDFSIVQGPFSVAPCQTLVSRFATFASLYGSYVQRDRPPPEDMFIGEPAYRAFIQSTLALRDTTVRVGVVPPAQHPAAHRFTMQPFLDT